MYVKLAVGNFIIKTRTQRKFGKCHDSEKFGKTFKLGRIRKFGKRSEKIVIIQNFPEQFG
jgi:pyoverdine/dityrosine biosynthesis protein Dit1